MTKFTWLNATIFNQSMASRPYTPKQRRKREIKGEEACCSKEQLLEEVRIPPLKSWKYYTQKTFLKSIQQ